MRAPQKEGDDDYLQKEELTSRLIEQHRDLIKTNQDLTRDLEKLRINSESELNLEKKHHEKTTLELNKIKYENRELKKNVQNLENKLQLKDQEIEDLKSRMEMRGTLDNRHHDRDKREQVEENRLLNRELREIQIKLEDKEEELANLKREYGQTYDQLLKEVNNRIAVLENEKKSLANDNQALREEFERVESERKILRDENVDLSRRCSELKARHFAIDLTTPNKTDLKYGNNSSPQSNTLRITKSLTTAKKMGEDRYAGEKDERLSAQRGQNDVFGMGLPECRKLISEIMEIFNLKGPGEILPSIKKTEKVMQAIPKLQRLLGEIAGIVFARSGQPSGENNIEVIVPQLKAWVNSLEDLEGLRELKAKIVDKLGLGRENDGLTILKNIDNLMYISFQYDEMRLRSQRDATENSEHRRIISQLESMLGTEPTVGQVKQMMTQRNDLNHFTNLVKVQLNLDPDISVEACFTHLLKYISTAKKDRQAGSIINKVQEALGCSVEAIVPTIEEMVGERRNMTAYGRRHFK